MRGQISFEFLLYIAVSAVALVAALSIYESSGAMQRTLSANIYMQELAASINGNMAYQGSSFYAYVPKSICNVTSEAMPVRSINGFPLVSGLFVDNTVCADSGGIEKLQLTMAVNGTYSLS